jgi:hypothetical protein
MPSSRVKLPGIHAIEHSGSTSVPWCSIRKPNWRRSISYFGRSLQWPASSLYVIKEFLDDQDAAQFIAGHGRATSRPQPSEKICVPSQTALADLTHRQVAGGEALDGSQVAWAKCHEAVHHSARPLDFRPPAFMPWRRGNEFITQIDGGMVLPCGVIIFDSFMGMAQVDLGGPDRVMYMAAIG